MSETTADDSQGTAGAGVSDRHNVAAGPQLTTEQVWHDLSKASFAVVSYVTPGGDPRSSGVLFKAVGHRLYVVVAPDSWKAKHIAITPRAAVTVPIHRGGLLALVAPIPPATVSFHAAAVVHPAGSMDVPAELVKLVPPERRDSSCVVELVPEGMFVTYGVGVPLLAMRDPAKFGGRAFRWDEEASKEMRIEYLHASTFGNGVMVAQELERQMADRGSSVDLHPIKQMDPTRLPVRRRLVAP